MAYRPLSEVYEISAEPRQELGARLELDDGRVFRYAKAGSTALIAGYVQQSAATIGSTTEQVNMTVTVAGAVGKNSVTITAVTDAITANLFKDGYLVTYDGTATQGGGQTYKIQSNGACGAAGNFAVTTYDPFIVAISTSAKAAVCKNPYDSVVIWAYATFTGIPVGVPLVAVTASYYCWLQTWGICGVWVDSTAALTVGADVVMSNAVDGSVEPDDAAKAYAHIGYALAAGAGSKCVPIFLRLAP